MGKLKVNGDIEATGLIKSNAAGIYRVNHFTTEEGVDSFQAIDTLQYCTIGAEYTPIGNDGVLISAGWSSGKYGAQIWIDDGGSSGGMKIRSYGAGNGTKWNEWQTVLTSGNYNSYAPSLTGTGASGNWNISVKNLYYAQELSTAELLDGFNEALRFKAGYWTNSLVPGCGNGIILNMGWTSATYGAQLAIDDDPTYFIALRQKNGSGWAEWKRIPMADGTGASGTWSININGTSGASNYLNYTNTDEINFASTTNDKVYFNYRNYSNNEASGNTAIKSYYFCDRNGSANATVYAGNYIGTWQGYSPSSFAEASHSHSYLPLSGGTLTGNLTITETKNILLRPNNSGYTAGIGYDTNGNECIALWAKNTVTRLRWYAGTDMTNMAAGTMMGITPDFEISKVSGAAVGYIGGNSILHSGGGDLNGAIILGKNDDYGMYPNTNNYCQLGRSDHKFWKMFATYGYFDTITTTQYGSSAPTSTSYAYGTLYFQT